MFNHGFISKGGGTYVDESRRKATVLQSLAAASIRL